MRGGAGAVSRLVCPRRLQEGVSYRACVVPAFDATLAPRGASRRGHVELPIYDSWTFRAGAKEDFEELVLRLHPVESMASLGTRPISAFRPWPTWKTLRALAGTPTIPLRRSSSRTARWPRPAERASVARRCLRRGVSYAHGPAREPPVRTPMPSDSRRTIPARCRGARAPAWRRRSTAGITPASARSTRGRPMDRGSESRPAAAGGGGDGRALRPGASGVPDGTRVGAAPRHRKGQPAAADCRAGQRHGGCRSPPERRDADADGSDRPRGTGAHAHPSRRADAERGSAQLRAARGGRHAGIRPARATEGRSRTACSVRDPRR